jgi:hypothetical protein
MQQRDACLRRRFILLLELGAEIAALKGDLDLFRPAVAPSGEMPVRKGSSPTVMRYTKSSRPR